MSDHLPRVGGLPEPEKYERLVERLPDVWWADAGPFVGLHQLNAAKILHPRRVELVQPHERACVGPPDVGQTLDESLVLLGLRQPAHPRQVIAHPGTRTPITSPSRIGTTAETTRGSVAASRLNARTPSVPGERSASSTTEP